jgi:hypothetical protein
MGKKSEGGHVAEAQPTRVVDLTMQTQLTVVAEANERAEVFRISVKLGLFS